MNFETPDSIGVGVASVDFTPPVGLPLMGNFRDDYVAHGVHDPLQAKSIVFADGHGTKAALLAVDICMLDRRNVASMRQVIGAACDVPPQHVLIHATHTHSAPAANGRIGLEAQVAPHTAAIEAFLRTAALAVAEANRRLCPAALAVGYAHEDHVSFNRRLRRRDGTTQMNWEALQPDFDSSKISEPWGPIDPELVCLLVQRGQTPHAALVNFGLHPAILAGDNWLYSADFPGYLAEAMSREQGDDFPCLFLNGCCGNVNHVDYRDRSQGRGYRMAEQVGAVLAAAAGRAMARAAPVAVDPVLVSRKDVQLDRLPISREEKRRCEEVLQRARLHPPEGQVDGVPEAYFAELRLKMWREQEHADQAEVMVIRIGDVAVVGLPGEAFCELGLEIKRRSPAQHTLVAGLSNDAIGYLPTEASFEQGGYETTVGSTFYAPGSAERIVASAVGQLEHLFRAGG